MQPEECPVPGLVTNDSWEVTLDPAQDMVAIDVLALNQHVYTIERIANATPYCNFTKRNSTGDIVWQKTFAIQLSDLWSDGTYIYVAGGSGPSMRVMKYSQAGGLVWSRDPGESDTTIEARAVCGADGRIFLLMSHNPATNQILIERYLESGSWNGSGSYNELSPSSIIGAASDGLYIYYLRTYYPGGAESGKITKMRASTFNDAWEKTVNLRGKDSFNSICILNNEIYVSHRSQYAGSYLEKYAANGTLMMNVTTPFQELMGLATDGYWIYGVGKDLSTSLLKMMWWAPNGTVLGWKKFNFSQGTYLTTVAADGGYQYIYMTFTGNGLCTSLIKNDIFPTKLSISTNNSNIIQGQSVQFNVSSLVNATNPASYQWFFEDGTNSTLEDPEHYFMEIGTFSIMLAAWDCDFDSITKNVTINVAADLTPSATFTANTTSIIEMQSVKFTHTGSNGNIPVSYQWSFDDGTPNSTVENPVHQFTTVATRTIRLTVVDVDGDIVTYTLPSTINVIADLLPNAIFTANTTSIHAGKSISFTHTGDNGNLPASYQWNFGDGTSNATIENPVHQFTAAGIYTIRLTIVDVDGDIAIYTLPSPINVDIIPSATFTSNTTSIVAGQSVSFTHTGTNGDPPATYQWNFGDGTPNATVENPVHQFTAAGTRTIQLTIVDVDGDTATYTLPSTINVAEDLLPSATFTANTTSIIAGQAVAFTHTGVNGNTPATYSWNFGDGRASILKNPVHQFKSSGTFTVQLNVTDMDGDLHTTTMIISVLPYIQAVASFSTNTTTVIAGQFIQFQFNGTTGNVPISYYWRFGDGSTSVQVNPTHQFNTAGMHSMNLTITDIFGNNSVASIDVTILQDVFPVSLFTANTTTLSGPGCIQFQFIGTQGNGPATFTWYFGDGTTSNVSNPVHRFNSTGTYDVILVVRDTDGDINQYSTRIAVIGPSTGNWFGNPTNVFIVIVIGAGLVAVVSVASVARKKKLKIQSSGSGKKRDGKKIPSHQALDQSRTGAGISPMKNSEIVQKMPDASAPVVIAPPAISKPNYICTNCHSRFTLSFPAGQAPPSCPSCSIAMSRLVPCPHCGIDAMIDQQFYQAFKGKVIQCSGCGKQFVLH
nr:PKD domain-containing protein [Candidatus Sigynarchaeota archaeon]